MPASFVCPVAPALPACVAACPRHGRWRVRRTAAARADTAPRGLPGRLCGRARRPAATSRSRSIPRHTAQKQPFDVQIHYPHHPQAGERVLVVREVHHAGRQHFVINSPDGTRGLLPKWMTEPSSANLLLVEGPVLPLVALRDLRATIDRALLSSALCSTRENGSDVGASSELPAGPPSPGDDGSRTRKVGTRNPSDSHQPLEATPDRVRIRRCRKGVVR